MEANTTGLIKSETTNSSFNLNTQLVNLILSVGGMLTNFLLFIVLLRLHRHQCTTYFLLTLMTVFDLIYCIVYISILITNQSYLNLINHQILCPLSFFLSPFAFTGSTLLLFICLIHLITNYVRRYDTFLGQIGGRLSVIFVLAFIIIRSVLGSTSIELISDPSVPSVQLCTIDMNTPEIVSKVQNINQIFAEVTDILVYLGWLILLCFYLFPLVNCQKSPFFYSFSVSKTHPLQVTSTRLTNQQRHRHVSLIIISITILSIVCFLPVMLNKSLTMSYIYFNQSFFSDFQIFYLQIIQQTAHLFCLSIRFVPYCIFDRQIRCLGWRCARKRKPKKSLQNYLCYCQCSRPRQLLELKSNKQSPIDV